MARLHHSKQDEETTYWLSYSDMMAGLLLVFVLIIALTTLHARMQFDEKQKQLVGKEEELLVKATELEEQQELVATQQFKLDEQQDALLAQQAQLTDQEEQLKNQELTLAQQHALLDELQKVMSEQQAQLDKIIGVRSDLIQALKEEFDDSDLSIAVDEQTGAITMDSSILFEYNEDSLKDSGKTFLDRFLPRYVNILMGPDYRQYVSEILIQGHTDTSGNYLYNLDLSQKRAYSVAAYCLDDENTILNKVQKERLESVLSTNGKSWSNPVRDSQGKIDEEASRRVEFLFRLKDEEMIREMLNILNDEQSQ